MTEPLPLPPLPEPDLETNGDVFGHENVEGYSAKLVHDYARAYGLACRNAALEEAAMVAEATWEGYDQSDDRGTGAFYGENSAAAIRKLKGCA